MRSFVFVALVAASLSIFGCSQPSAPEITVKAARVTELSLSGLTLAVDAEAFNPNDITLNVQRVSGTVRIDDKYELGKVTVPVPTTLPARARTPLSVPLAMKWQNLTILTGIAARSETIPYTVTGTVAVGGEKLSLDVPFQVQGTLTREQIM